MNVTVLGAGAWGTALAVHAAAAHPTRSGRATPAQAAQLRATRRNARYLPEVVLPPALQVGADFAAALAHGAGGIVVVATPMAGLEPLLRRLAGAASTPPVLWLCKGFQDGTGALGHEIARSGRPGGARRRALGAELRDRGRARPADRAGRGEQRRRPCARRRSPPSTTPALRIYTSADPVGVEVGGAVKNVLAIATGIADGMGSASTRAPRWSRAAWPR